eukprot:15329421-Ditylum_brightwellii.AAC.1
MAMGSAKECIIKYLPCADKHKTNTAMGGTEECITKYSPCAGNCKANTATCSPEERITNTHHVLASTIQIQLGVFVSA